MEIHGHEGNAWKCTGIHRNVWKCTDMLEILSNVWKHTEIPDENLAYIYKNTSVIYSKVEQRVDLLACC